jgi:thioredoxin 1
MLTVKYFSTTWCSPCRAFAPVFDNVMSSAGVNFNKIDAEQNKELALQYSISSVPTLIFEKDNTVVHRHTGVMSRSQLEATIDQFR